MEMNKLMIRNTAYTGDRNEMQHGQRGIRKPGQDMRLEFFYFIFFWVPTNRIERLFYHKFYLNCFYSEKIINYKIITKCFVAMVEIYDFFDKLA